MRLIDTRFKVNRNEFKWEPVCILTLILTLAHFQRAFVWHQMRSWAAHECSCSLIWSIVYNNAITWNGMIQNCLICRKRKIKLVEKRGINQWENQFISPFELLLQFRACSKQQLQLQQLLQRYFSVSNNIFFAECESYLTHSITFDESSCFHFIWWINSFDDCQCWFIRRKAYFCFLFSLRLIPVLNYRNFIIINWIRSDWSVKSCNL